MLRYLICLTLLSLGFLLLARSAWLFRAAHRIGARVAPIPTLIDAPDVPAESVDDRFDVRVSIGEIMDRTVH